ncbi:MAG: hypothetical protein PHR56_03365 [Dehalococcoidales bacterium]|nr:hypothetical protein [Dehalococcoidales bacterium]
MNIEWWRDLVIVVFGIAATVLAILCTVMMLVFYKRIKPVVESVKKTAETIENISSTVEDEIVKPLSQLGAFIQGIRQVINMMGGRFSKKKEDKSDG